MDRMIESAKQVSLFCRLNLNRPRELPIRSSEMGMLIYLVKTDEMKTPNAAARFFKVTKAMVTNMVTSLLSNGYIEKRQLETDRRSYELIPTAKAVRLVEDTYKDYFKTMSLLEAKLGKEKFDALICLLTAANEILLEEKSDE